jgi:hypothetical protein
MAVNADSGHLPVIFKNQNIWGLRRWHMSRNVLLSPAMLCLLFCIHNLGAQTSSFQPDVPSGEDLNSIIKTIAIERPVINLASAAVAELDTSGNLRVDSSTEDSLPDDPTQQNPVPTRKPQTKRILGIVPNFRSVSADAKLPPQSAKQKFVGAAEDSFDYSSFIFAGLVAGVADAERSTPEFQHGAAAYGRYYWHTFADQTDENFQVEYIFPAVLHQDPRYYTLGHGGFLKRTVYSFSRVLITRTDAGHETVNASEIVGAGAASGISDLYYPSPERTWTKTGQRWLLNVSIDGGTFIFKEFWPDINNKFFHQKD